MSPKHITGTAQHHQIANNYRQLPANCGLLPANYRHLYGLHYKKCLPLPAIYRQGWSIYRRLPPAMKNYRHAGNVVMTSCTSSGDVSYSAVLLSRPDDTPASNEHGSRGGIDIHSAANGCQITPSFVESHAAVMCVLTRPCPNYLSRGICRVVRFVQLP